MSLSRNLHEIGLGTRRLLGGSSDGSFRPLRALECCVQVPLRYRKPLRYGEPLRRLLFQNFSIPQPSSLHLLSAPVRPREIVRGLRGVHLLGYEHRVCACRAQGIDFARALSQLDAETISLTGGRIEMRAKVLHRQSLPRIVQPALAELGEAGADRSRHSVLEPAQCGYGQGHLFANGEHAQPVAMQELEARIAPAQFAPQPPDAEIARKNILDYPQTSASFRSR